MPPIVADPVISFLRERAHTQEYAHQADYCYPSHGPSELPSMGKGRHATSRYNYLTRWRLPAGSNGFFRHNDTTLGASAGVARGRLEGKLAAAVIEEWVGTDE